MTDVVERVAKAIFWSMCSIMHDHDKLWHKTDKKEIYLDVARAAIAAMQQPLPVKTMNREYVIRYLLGMQEDAADEDDRDALGAAVHYLQAALK